MIRKRDMVNFIGPMESLTKEVGKTILSMVKASSLISQASRRMESGLRV